MKMCFILLAVAIYGQVKRILAKQDLDSAWNRFFWILPSVIFALNLFVFYALSWITRLTQPNMNPRQIARKGRRMGELEYGPMKPPILC